MGTFAIPVGTASVVGTAAFKTKLPDGTIVDGLPPGATFSVSSDAPDVANVEQLNAADPLELTYTFEAAEKDDGIPDEAHFSGTVLNRKGEVDLLVTATIAMTSDPDVVSGSFVIPGFTEA